VRVGVSGLAVGNSSGLGRLSRIYLLALASAAPQWELHVYLRSPHDIHTLRAECDQQTQSALDNLVPHYPPTQALNRLLLEEWDLPRQFARLKLDAYLGCDFTLPPAPLAKREVVILPDLIPFTNPGTVSWRARWLYRRGVRRSLRRRACMLCISQHTLETLRRLFPRDSSEARVVYPALSPRLWQLARQLHVSDHALQVTGSLHQLVDPGRFILSVGVAGPRKNTELLVRVYRSVVLDGEYRGSLVLVGGDGRFHTAPYGTKLALQPVGLAPAERSHGAEIHDLGRVSDHELSQLYAAADLLVCLSTEEGFGFPVLEALAHGTPALVTAGSSMTEIAERGIAATPLNFEECRQRLVSTVHAQPLLRQEAACLPVEKYSVERLGRELLAALQGGGSKGE